MLTPLIESMEININLNRRIVIFRRGLIQNVSKFKWPVHNSIDNPEIWDSNGRIVLSTYNNT